MDLSVCLVATELFEWGRFGGFGRCTRTIGSELARRGIEVSVVVPRSPGQKPIETLDGMTVHSFPLLRYPFTKNLYRRCNADVYHSEEPSWGTRLAMEEMPEKKHITTIQNPKTMEDWRVVNRYYPVRRRLFNRFYSKKIREMVRRLDSVFCQARYIIPKVRSMYGLTEEPRFLPNPVDIPKERMTKASEPTVCFLGRFDGEKRPELFFELARRFPEVKFIALGKAHDYARDRILRDSYGSVSNLDMPGFKAGPEKDLVLERSWILVNTSVSECLPMSFLEAAAHECAILSFNNPDSFASEFGCHVTDGNLEKGLASLLKDENWRVRGKKGFEYVSNVHGMDKVIDQHVSIYRELLEG